MSLRQMLAGKQGSGRIYNRLGNTFPWLPPVYRRIAHREPWPPFRRTFTRAALHYRIKEECGDMKGGVFFEAGAADGLLFSNTAYLEKYLNWTGILVEPVPHKFVECVRNRPGSIVEHCALVSPEFPSDHVKIRYSGLTSRGEGAASGAGDLMDGQKYLLGWERKLLGQIFLAPAMTISALLDKHGVDHIDLMVLDMEGAELDALKGVDFDACRIGRLLVEALHGLGLLDEYLSAKGFRRMAEFSYRD